MKMKIAITLVTLLCYNLMLPFPVVGQGSSSYCRFPFIFKNVSHSSCTTEGDPDGKLWCSTRTDNLNNHIVKMGYWKHCQDKALSTQNPGGCVGDCISIQQCPALNALLQKAKTDGDPDAIVTLRNSICDGLSFRVCCPRTTTPTRQIKRICGLTTNREKIVGGKNAGLGSWPWMVIFSAREIKHDEQTATGSEQWTCSGVLITDQYILSAAHCFGSTVQVEFVRIGEFDLSKDLDKEGDITAPKPQDISVDSVIKHPKFGTPCNKCNDIALVKLIKPAELIQFFVQPICLPSNPEQDIGFPVSGFQQREGFTTGWGVTDAGEIFTTRLADILQQANLMIQELPFCGKQKQNYPDGNMILCAGQGDGKDVCRGDSGGPLMIIDQTGSKWFVVGITSFGSTICGSRDTQGVFTSVHYYMDWINKNIL